MLPGLIAMGGKMAAVSAPPVVPPVVSYIGVTHDTGNASSYSLASVAIGTAAADRIVFALVTWASDSSTQVTISSATIGGVSATAHAHVTTVASDAIGSAIISAAVPTGTTATIAITLSGSGGSLDVGVLAVTGLASQTPHASSTATTAAGACSTTVNVPAGGFVLACANFADEVSGTTWVGATARYDESNTDGSAERTTGASEASLTVQTGRTVSATSVNTGSNVGCMSVAAWG